MKKICEFNCHLAVAIYYHPCGKEKSNNTGWNTMIHNWGGFESMITPVRRQVLI